MPARTTRLIRSQPRSQRQRPPLPVGVRPAPMRSAIHQRASPGRLRECHLSTTAAWPKEECQPRTVVSNPRPWPPARSGCDALLPEDRKPIPESDMPPGTPPWMRSSSGRPAWAAPLMLSAPQSRSGSRPASGPGRSRPGQWDVSLDEAGSCSSPRAPTPTARWLPLQPAEAVTLPGGSRRLGQWKTPARSRETRHISTKRPSRGSRLSSRGGRLSSPPAPQALHQGSRPAFRRAPRSSLGRRFVSRLGGLAPGRPQRAHDHAADILRGALAQCSSLKAGSLGTRRRRCGNSWAGRRCTTPAAASRAVCRSV